MKTRELKKVAKDKIGRAYNNGVHLEPHEYKTILHLVLFGFNVEVLKPSNTPKTHSPDFLIDGTIWETKSPEGNGQSTIARQFHKAGKQADKLILDLRRIKIPAVKAEKEAIRRLEASRSIKRLLLITKDGRLLDIQK